MFTVIVIALIALAIISIFVRPLNNFWTILWGYVSTTVQLVVVLVRHYGGEYVRILWNISVYTIIGLAAMFLFAFLIESETLTSLVAILASIVALISWKGTSIILYIADRLAFSNCSVKRVTDDVRAFFYPLLTIALFFSFIASIVSIKGFGNFGWSDLLIWSSIILFFSILSLFWTRKTLFFQYLMAGLVIFALAGDYLFPTEIKSVVNYFSRGSKQTSHSINTSNREGDLVLIKAYTPLFTESGDEDYTVWEDTKAKIISTIDANDGSGEQLYKVVLPVSEGLYYGGKTTFVPVRLTGEIQKREEVQNETKQINYSAPTQQDDNIETIVVEPRKVKGSHLDFVDGDHFKVLSVSGDALLTEYSKDRKTGKNMTPMEYGEKYKVHVDEKVVSGPLFFFSTEGATITIQKY